MTTLHSGANEESSSDEGPGDGQWFGDLNLAFVGWGNEPELSKPSSGINVFYHLTWTYLMVDNVHDKITRF